MTKIKLCGMTRMCDIRWANQLKPDYIGFVFFPKSKRYVSPEKALELRKMLDPAIRAVGVFVNEDPQVIARLIRDGVIDIAQLHGQESEETISALRQLTDAPIFKAFRIDSIRDAENAAACSADQILVDSGSGGTGQVFDWELLKQLNRPYFLAGGLSTENIGLALAALHPYGVDVSSGIETDGVKDEAKMTAFVKAVRNNQ